MPEAIVCPAGEMKTLLAVALGLVALQEAPRIEMRGGSKAITNAPRASATTRNVLIVGNSLSYFNEMPWMLEQIARSKEAQPPLHVEFSGGSGLTLEQHWKQGKALRRIAGERWDFVVLQAQSTEAMRAPATFEEYARRFHEAVLRGKGRTVILETWAPRHSPYSQASFHEEYQKAANRIGARLAPVGTAWTSLNARGINLFEDDTHPNVAGSYLVACVLYAVVYGKTPVGATHTFDVHFDIPEFYRRSLERDRINEETAAAIQRSAWAIVQRR